MPLFIAALLGLTGALIVIFPLLGVSRERQASQQAGGELGEVADRERQARQALREVELDYTLGNLESSDYDALRNRYERRALAALRTRYQREQELDAQIERELDTLRGATPQSRSRAGKIATTPTIAPDSTTPATRAKPSVASANPPAASRSLKPANLRVSRQVVARDRRVAPKRKGGA
jgi:hypothetical protein